MKKKVSVKMNRRSVIKKIGGAGGLLTLGAISMASSTVPEAPRPVLKRMKITGGKIIMTGSDIYVKISTDAGPLGTAATLHAALNIPNITLIEAPWANGYSEPKVVKPYPVIENGFALPLEGPGLGVEFDEAAAAKIPFNEITLQLRLNSQDGSVMDF